MLPLSHSYSSKVVGMVVQQGSGEGSAAEPEAEAEQVARAARDRRGARP